jgi:hypothetical protein
MPDWSSLISPALTCATSEAESSGIHTPLQFLDAQPFPQKQVFKSIVDTTGMPAARA